MLNNLGIKALRQFLGCFFFVQFFFFFLTHQLNIFTQSIASFFLWVLKSKHSPIVKHVHCLLQQIYKTYKAYAALGLFLIKTTTYLHKVTR